MPAAYSPGSPQPARRSAGRIPDDPELRGWSGRVPPPRSRDERAPAGEWESGVRWVAPDRPPAGWMVQPRGRKGVVKESMIQGKILNLGKALSLRSPWGLFRDGCSL